MKETGILMATDMVRAILEGKKTQTRRARGLEEMNESPNDWFFDGGTRFYHEDGKAVVVKCPYGQVGDRLWVRETFCILTNPYTKERHVDYKAMMPNATLKWKPSIHMPRWASRITLEITEVRVERYELKNITQRDIDREGGDTALILLGEYEGKWTWALRFKVI